MPLLHHTENVHLSPYSPDYVALLCVRPDPRGQARTTLVHVDDVVAALPEAVVETLRLPHFHVGPPVSFRGRGVGTGPFAVLRGPRRRLQVAADLTDMVGLTKAADEALAVLLEVSDRCSTEVDLRAGDLLLVDNRRVLHGRTSFEPAMDGNDRWCLRTLVRSGDLWDWRVYVQDRCLVF